MSEGFQDRLAQFKEQYDKVSEEGPELPFGTPVIARLTDAVLDVTNSGKDIIKEKWVILEGEFQGQNVPLNQFPLSSDFGIRNYKVWAHILGGFENPPIEDMEEIVAAISNANPVAKIQLRKSNQFINYDLIERLDASEVSSAPRASVTRKPAATQQAATAAEESAEEDGVEVDVGTTIQFDLEGTEVTAKVTKVADDGSLSAEFEDEGEVVTVDEIPLDDVTVLEDSPDEAPAESGVSDILAALAEAQEVDVTSDDTDETVGKKLSEYVWEAKELTADEVEALEAVGVEVVRPKLKPKAKKKAKKKAKAKKAKKKARRK